MTTTVSPTERIVVLIHGIRTHASWAEMVAAVLEPLCRAKVIPLRYGYFDVFRFLCPFFTRRGPIERIVRELRDIRAEHPTVKISVIAHSFGTYSIVKALAERDIRLDRVILCGCIVPESFRRAEFAAQLGESEILNDCGTHDIWPVLARSATWGYGASGTFGFGTHGVRDRFNKFSHGDYFDKTFVEEYWAPFIRDGTIKPTAWEEKRNTPPIWQSMLAWLRLRYLILAVIMAGIYFGVAALGGKETLVFDAGPQVTVGHYLGVPWVATTLRVHNGFSREAQIESITARLISPSGKEWQMNMEGIGFSDGRMSPPIPIIFARARENADLDYSFFNLSPEFLAWRETVVRFAMSNALSASAPDETKELLPAGLTSQLVAFARSKFIWEPGPWTLRFDAQFENAPLALEKAFVLTSNEVARMWRITDFYKSGIGVFPVWRLVAMNDYQPSLHKTFLIPPPELLESAGTQPDTL